MAKTLGEVRKYGLDTLIPLDRILEVCGLEDTLWSLRIIIEPADKEIRLLACDYAERVLSIFEEIFPDDKRPRVAIETARKYANSEASEKELNAAACAACAAWAGRAAACAAWAAEAARDAAWDAEGEWQKQHLLEMLNR